MLKCLCNFIEIALRHGCPPVNWLHISRTSFYKNTSRGLLLYVKISNYVNQNVQTGSIKNS